MTLYAKYMTLDGSAHGIWHFKGLSRETSRRRKAKKRHLTQDKKKSKSGKSFLEIRESKNKVQRKSNFLVLNSFKLRTCSRTHRAVKE